MSDTKRTTSKINKEEHLHDLLPFNTFVKPELLQRIKAFSRTEEDRIKFTQNALSMLADVYEGKRQMPGSTVRYQDKTEEHHSFF